MEVWTIINITPDSFYAGSRANSSSEIIQAARTAIDQGADRLDIGAFSTKPGHDQVSEQEELRRLDGALSIIRQEFPLIPLSIDTFRSSIVESLHHNFGTFAVNDVQGGLHDKGMLPTVGRLNLPYVMMSNDPTMSSMLAFFDSMIGEAKACGIRQIILDPGFGFGKDLRQNYAVMQHLSQLKVYGCEILAGISRKSMIYLTLQTTPDHAAHGTTALHWAALSQGATILRAHDTLAAKQTIKLYQTFTSSVGCQ